MIYCHRVTQPTAMRTPTNLLNKCNKTNRILARIYCFFEIFILYFNVTNYSNIGV